MRTGIDSVNNYLAIWAESLWTFEPEWTVKPTITNLTFNEIKAKVVIGYFQQNLIKGYRKNHIYIYIYIIYIYKIYIIYIYKIIKW